MNFLENVLDDPYNIKELAPFGFDFLMAAAIGRHNRGHALRVRKFINQKTKPEVDLFSDFIAPVQERFYLSTDSVDFDDSLSKALFNRQSVRSFSGQSVDFAQISFLLRLAAGIKSKNPNIKENQKRFYPSGGALNTLRIYLDVRHVQGLKNGLYRFNPFESSLDLVNSDINDEQRARLHNEEAPSSAYFGSAFEILITTRPRIALKKYGEHGWKVILMEMGHLAQNLWLVGVGIGLGMYPSSSFSLNEAHKLLRYDPKSEFLLYSLICGFEITPDSQSISSL